MRYTITHDLTDKKFVLAGSNRGTRDFIYGRGWIVPAAIFGIWIAFVASFIISIASGVFGSDLDPVNVNSIPLTIIALFGFFGSIIGTLGLIGLLANNQVFGYRTPESALLAAQQALTDAMYFESIIDEANKLDEINPERKPSLRNESVAEWAAKVWAAKG